MSGVRKFISFEGIEGSGKTTHARNLAEYLTRKGHDVMLTAEPGGTAIGNRIRGLLLDPQNRMEPMTELLLYYASRAQHVREIIYPALLKNRIVITDRFTDSTVAYQGYARGIDLSLIAALNEIVVQDLKPSITFLLDLDAEEGLRRNRKANKEDRFELEAVEFHKRVREGFLRIAEEEHERVKVVDASGDARQVGREIERILEDTWR
jgi:dTMP kinase